MRKIKLFTLLAAAMFATSMWAENIASQGSCGDGLTYKVTYLEILTNPNRMTLEIFWDGEGTGAMNNYSASLYSTCPWLAYRHKLVSITLPEGLTTIGNGALWECDNEELTTLTIPSTVTSIGGYSAIDIPHLQTLTCLPTTAPTLGTLGNGAIDRHADNLEIIYPCGSGASYVNGWSTFYQYLTPATPCDEPKPAFYAVGTCGRTGSSVNYVMSNGVLTITNVSGGRMASYTGSDKQPWSAWRNLITSVVIGEGITEIGRNNFADCANLTTISLPSTLTTIGNSAFAASGLVSVSLPSNVASIGNTVFEDCTSLESIDLPANNSTSYGGNFLRGCSSMQEINYQATEPASLFVHWPADFPETCKYYYPNGYDEVFANHEYTLAFWNYLYNKATGAHAPYPHGSGTTGECSWTFSMTLKSGGDPTKRADYVGLLAISGSGAMADYDFYTDLYPDYQAYSNLNFVDRIEIGSGVTKIGAMSFMNITTVNTFIIPASVTEIGTDAFFGCNNPNAEVYIYANPASLTWNDGDCDDFLSITRGPWNTAVWHVAETKCFVPSQYLQGYKDKWAIHDHEWGSTDVNVFFASKLQDGEDAEYINNALNDLDGKTAPVLTLVRPLNRDGYFATLCLPFDMSAEQLAESSLHGAEIKEFTDAAVVSGSLELTFSPVSEIKAGKPYFIKYADAEVIGDALDRLDFMDVTIKNVTPQQVKHGDVTMIGTYVPVNFPAQTGYSGPDDILFLKSENKLAWPTAAGTLKPFRCYFKVNTSGSGGAALKRGMPARIIEVEKMPTAIENAAVDGEYNKMIQDGQLIVIKNGVKYNAQGQIVK